MSFSFNGTTDRIDWDNISNLAGSPVTISLWVYYDGFGTVRDDMFCITKAGTPETAGIEFCIGSAISVQFLRTGATSLYRAMSNGVTALPTGVWFHILVTHDGTFNDYATIHIYKDGTEFTDTTTQQNGVTEGALTGTWSLGGRVFDDARNYDGKLAEIGVWNRVLNATEIAGLAGGWYPNDVPSNLIFYFSGASDDLTAEVGGEGTADGAVYDASHPTMEDSSSSTSSSTRHCIPTPRGCSIALRVRRYHGHMANYRRYTRISRHSDLGSMVSKKL